MTERDVLALRIRECLVDVKRAVDRALLIAEKARRTGDDAYWDAVALNLHGFYTGTERILDDIARTMEGVVPEGPDWHSRLLAQLAAAAPGVRPAVLLRETRQCLDEYRMFRHVVRNVYAVNFRPARLADLVAELPACFERVQRDLDAFARFLEDLEQDGQ